MTNAVPLVQRLKEKVDQHTHKSETQKPR